MYTTDIFTLTDDIIIAHYKTAMHSKKGEYIIDVPYLSNDYKILSNLFSLYDEFYKIDGIFRVKYSFQLLSFMTLLQALKDDWYIRPTNKDSEFRDDCCSLYSNLLYTIGIELV